MAGWYWQPCRALAIRAMDALAWVEDLALGAEDSVADSEEVPLVAATEAVVSVAAALVADGNNYNKY